MRAIHKYIEQLANVGPHFSWMRSLFLLATVSFLSYYGSGSEQQAQRGIIFSMGPMESHFMGVYASVRLIRQTSSLPIEIWCYPFELPQMPEKAMQALQSFADVSIKLLPHPDPSLLESTRQVDLKDIQKGRSWKTDYLHFSAKPLALLTSNLTEVPLPAHHTPAAMRL